MKKSFLSRLISFAVCAVLCLSLFPITASAAVSTRDLSFEEAIAKSLKHLGLFKGVSDTDFGLEKAPSRAEALVMYVRTLGKEKEALSGSYTHPFTDVPSWADKYVGYAYKNELTNGVSETLFGSEEGCGSNMYLTFILRALGYSERYDNNFTWEYPYALAARCGILPHNVDTENFLRADAALISYAALTAIIKDSTETLAEKLIKEEVFTRGQFEQYVDKTMFADSINYQKTLSEIYGENNYNYTFLIYKIVNTKNGCIALSLRTGVPHLDQYSLHLVLLDGSAIRLPLPNHSYYSVAVPEGYSFSKDGNTLFYFVTFTERAAMYNAPGHEYVIHEKGTYNYTVNLLTGETSLTITNE